MKTTAPKAAHNRQLRDRTRDILVTLGQCPGLGLKVLGSQENCVLLFPRLHKLQPTLADILKFKWYEVNEDTLEFRELTRENIEEFLHEL